MAQRDEEASQVEECRIHLDVMIIANHQPTEVTQPGKCAFDFPALAIATQAAPVVEREPAAALRLRKKPSPQSWCVQNSHSIESRGTQMITCK